jgi:hypothetical protein
MKRFGAALFAALVWFSLSAFAQYGGQQSSTSDQTKTATSTEGGAGKLHHLKGQISDDGKTFTSSKDSKSWTIANPDAVKGHEGHDVSLSAHVYPDKNEIHVTAVKMAGEKSSTKKKGGAMSEQPPQ